MSTFMKKQEQVSRKWYIVDAADKPLGRVATQISTILTGKHRPDYTPHVDGGDCVIVLNAAKVVLTGDKLNKKFYRYHTGHIGGLKEVSYKRIMETKPEKAIELAVKGMMPKNKIAAAALTRLRVFAGAEHNLGAQKPEVFEK
ncbi:MAG: 50S ribosomal protein L13 [Clostridiales bacterium]|nr:MAG: 50S ribosomal protein L13 [Clostridiales bacterium]